jgi:hypothetical protein
MDEKKRGIMERLFFIQFNVSKVAELFTYVMIPTMIIHLFLSIHPCAL